MKCSKRIIPGQSSGNWRSLWDVNNLLPMETPRLPCLGMTLRQKTSQPGMPGHPGVRGRLPDVNIKEGLTLGGVSWRIWSEETTENKLKLSGHFLGHSSLVLLLTLYFHWNCNTQIKRSSLNILTDSAFEEQIQSGLLLPLASLLAVAVQMSTPIKNIKQNTSKGLRPSRDSLSYCWGIRNIANINNSYVLRGYIPGQMFYLFCKLRLLWSVPVLTTVRGRFPYHHSFIHSFTLTCIYFKKSNTGLELTTLRSEL